MLIRHRTSRDVRLKSAAVAAIFSLFSFLALAPGWAGAAESKAPPLVFAAASLTDVLTHVADAYAKTGHIRPKFSFAASSALAKQIENGAPAALFLSADEDWMDYLSARNLIDPASRADLLANSLVLITPVDQPLHFDIAAHFPLASALGDDHLAMADTDAVPAGKYGRAALVQLGVWDAVAPNVIRLDSVRAALAMVARREAAVGVVYRTDALVSKQVRIAGVFPSSSHPPIRYPMALVATAAKDPEARAFAAFLKSPAAAAIFRADGFLMASE